MQHPIDPKIDCVFKALLGTEVNRNLLIHFLNAMLAGELTIPISEVDILNPYNEREFLDDKLSIVDVKARDGQGRLYQIEIQMLSYRYLPARILYTWADLYSQQLKSGQDYALLRPTYALWVLAEDLLTGDTDWIHDYQLRDAKGRRLLPHGGIWLLELGKFNVEQVATEQQRWLKFFKDGERLDEGQLPGWMNTDEMRQAMGTLQQFSEKERQYHAYQARQNYLREQRSIQKELEEYRQEREEYRQERERYQQDLEAERREKEAERREKEAERREKETALQREGAALAEIERLKAILGQ